METIRKARMVIPRTSTPRLAMGCLIKQISNFLAVFQQGCLSQKRRVSLIRSRKLTATERVHISREFIFWKPDDDLWSKVVQGVMTSGQWWYRGWWPLVMVVQVVVVTFLNFKDSTLDSLFLSLAYFCYMKTDSDHQDCIDSKMAPLR